MKPFRVALSVRHKHVSSQKAYYGGNLLLLVKFERQEYSCLFFIFARKMGLHIRPETGSHAVCIWSAVSCEASARAKQLQGWCWWWALWETGHKSDGVTTKTFSYRRFFFSVVALMPSTLLCYYCRLCFFFLVEDQACLRVLVQRASNNKLAKYAELREATHVWLVVCKQTFTGSCELHFRG